MTFTWLTLVGHLSFLLAAASFLMTSMIWLRALAVLSLIIGVGYNSIIALHEPELWTVVGWQCVFLAINIGRSVRLVIDNTEVRLSESDKQLASEAFPLMRSRDFQMLLRTGMRRSPIDGDTLLEIGGETNSLVLVVAGRLLLTDADGATSILGRGRMFGDVTLALGEQYGGSPVRIVATPGTEIVEIDYGTLRALRERNPTFAYALTDGILRGMAKKARLLLPACSATPGDVSIGEVFLTEVERIVHARAMPQLTTSDVRKLFAFGFVESYADGVAIENKGRLGIVCAGSVTVVRDDDQQICLGQGNFLGEVAWVAERDPKVPSRLVADANCEILWFEFEVLAGLRRKDPLLMARLADAVMRNMAIKLTWPLTGGQHGSYDFAAAAVPAGVGT